MATSISGLGSGLDIDSIVTSLIAVESQSQNKLKTALAAHKATVSTFQTLNSTFSGLKTSTQDLSLGLNWKVNKATSSSANVTTTAGSSAVPGSFTFSVQNLASAHTLTTGGTVSSLDTVIGSGKVLNGNTNTLGLTGLKSTNLAAGDHTFAVTQASSGASASGTALGSDAIVIGSNETLEVNISGAAKSIPLTAGTYTRAQLAEMVTTASGGELKATLNNDNSLKLTTTHEGSAASLQVTTSKSALGLTAGTASSGTNGIVTVDGVSNTLSSIKPGQAVTLNGASGATVNANFSGGLRAGTATVKSIDMGSGTLSDVVQKINASGMGMTAAAIQVSPGAYKLQVQSTSTGQAGAITADLSQFTSAMGSFQTIQEAKDATIKVGSGASAYSVTSSTNAMKDVLPGVTLNLNVADPTLQVTVSVGGDNDALAAKVQKLIDGANSALSFIRSNSKYDAASKTAGPLQGNSMARSLQQQLVTAVSDSVGGSDLVSGYAVGITMTAEGTFAFDKAKFASAYAADPEKVTRLYVDGGTTGTMTGNPGIAERLGNVVKNATDVVSGMITTAVAGRNSTIADITKNIADWDTRLSKRAETLKRQYAAMDTLIAGFKNQSNWLAGQINGLSSGN